MRQPPLNSSVRCQSMRTELVEIYSDQTNAAVLRHPGRKFPGVLVQGDTLHSLCLQADAACSGARGMLQADAYDELSTLQDHLRSLLDHYKSVLAEHDIPLPFSEACGA